MSDRVAVMSGGRVEQAGTPREMYEEPATLFVADFLGVSNLLGADASADGEACSLRVGERTLRAAAGATDARGEVKAMIRPERIAVEAHGTSGDNRLPGMVERAVYVGSAHELHVRLVGGDLLKATVRNDGSVVRLRGRHARDAAPAGGGSAGAQALTVHWRQRLKPPAPGRSRRASARAPVRGRRARGRAGSRGRPRRRRGASRPAAPRPSAGIDPSACPSSIRSTTRPSQTRYERSTSGRSSSSERRLLHTSFQSARCSLKARSGSTPTSSMRSTLAAPVVTPASSASTAACQRSSENAKALRSNSRRVAK